VLTREIPSNFTARIFGYEPKATFTVTNEAAISAPPAVSFDKPAAAPPAPAASK
jgi:LemA protein